MAVHYRLCVKKIKITWFRVTSFQICYNVNVLDYMSTLAKLQRADLKSCMGLCVCSRGGCRRKKHFFLLRGLAQHVRSKQHVACLFHCAIKYQLLLGGNFTLQGILISVTIYTMKCISITNEHGDIQMNKTTKTNHK